MTTASTGSTTVTACVLKAPINDPSEIPVTVTLRFNVNITDVTAGGDTFQNNLKQQMADVLGKRTHKQEHIMIRLAAPMCPRCVLNLLCANLSALNVCACFQVSLHHVSLASTLQAAIRSWCPSVWPQVSCE